MSERAEIREVGLRDELQPVAQAHLAYFGSLAHASS